MTEFDPYTLMHNPTRANAAFWEACDQGRLVTPKCEACGNRHFPPQPTCPHCQQRVLVWAPCSGRATLYSYSVIHRPPVPGLRTPFVFASVDLEEGVSLFTNIIGVDESDLTLGMELKVVFHRLDKGGALPFFTAA
jgi:uncharacterized OB-fold protein